MRFSPLLICGLCLLSNGIAHAKIDRSAYALLDRATKRYTRFKSFSVTVDTTGYTTGYTPLGGLRARAQLSYQSLQRASIVISLLDKQGRAGRVLLRQLLGPHSFYSSSFDAPVEVKPVKTGAERAAFLRQLKEAQVALALGVMGFADPPEHDPKTGKRRVTLASLIREGKLRSITRRKVGATMQVRVVPLSSTPQKPPLMLIYGFNNRTLFLESLRVEIEAPDKKTRNTYVATYSAPISNWKGSQSATDQQVYNWKVVAPRVEAQQTLKPVITVEPAARAIFERASDLYSNLKTWRLKWRETHSDHAFDSDAPGSKTILFDRAGRVRIEDPQGLESLVVIDGKARYAVDTSSVKLGGRATYTRESIEKSDETHALAEIVDAGQGMLENLLEGDNPLEDHMVQLQASVGKLRSLSAKVLPPQPFGGGACDIVRITTRYLDAATARTGETTEQRTFWFARSDGRLMRWQTKSVEGNSSPTTTDAQVQTQDFDPVLSAQEFVFTQPTGAVLSK